MFRSITRCKSNPNLRAAALRSSKSNPNLRAAARNFSATPPVPVLIQRDLWAFNPAIYYDELKQYTRHPTAEITVIDTREAEDAMSSPIWAAVNVPLSRVKLAFSPNFHPGQFQEEFGFPKPTNTQKIVFIDRSGNRSQVAAEAARKYGFPNVRTYSEGLPDWYAHEKRGGVHDFF